MITYFWVATLTCEDSVDPTMAIQFLDSNIWDVNRSVKIPGDPAMDPF